MALRARYDKIEENFGASGWKQELAVINRQRKSVFFVMALLVVMAAFWTSFWVWTVFFGVMALYSLWVGVRMGFVCGVSFSLWFIALNKQWVHPETWQNQVAGLWCLATLFFLVVWKADEKDQLMKLHAAVHEEVE